MMPCIVTFVKNKEVAMIPEINPFVEHYEWQKQLRNGVRDVKQLLNLLNLDVANTPYAKLADQQFPLRVPLSFVARMQSGELFDPLLQQVLPVEDELNNPSDFSVDPLQEANSNVLPGLLHKYHGRVLLTVASACAINCRYCFRRHFPYQENSLTKERLQAIVDYIKHDSSIKEVILSGGDPLVAKDDYLAKLITALATINHLTTVRMHSRLPIVLPERITENFIQTITFTRLKAIMVVHCNHPQEINNDVSQKLLMLSKAGIPVLNQSVLLKNINDDAAVLADLSQRLFAANVLPYYLHCLDKVKGSAHFFVPEDNAIKLINALREQLPGYLVPKLVKEKAGDKSKTIVV